MLKDASGEKLSDDKPGTKEGGRKLKHDRKVVDPYGTKHEPEHGPKQQAEPEGEQAELDIAVVEKFHNHFSIQELPVSFTDNVVPNVPFHTPSSEKQVLPSGRAGLYLGMTM